VSFSGSSMGRYSRIWLWITGIIMLVLGAFFIVGLGNLPFAGGAMLMTGYILAGVGILLIVIGLIVGRRAAAVDEILTTGTAGTAQVTGVTQTGMYLNEQPQLDLQLMVSVPGRAPYPARHKSFVPLMLMGRVTSGQPLAVRVDPVDPQKLVVDWQSSGFASAPMGMSAPAPMPMTGAAPATTSFTGVDESLSQVQAALAGSGTSAASPYANAQQGSYSVEQLREYLRQSGLQAEATIDTLTDTGKIVGDERLYTMSTTLRIPGQAPQSQRESAAMVPLTAMHKVRVGATVPVRYAADNPNLMMFEWDKIKPADALV
jgi:hypothetical protein